MSYSHIREEELKNKVAQDYFLAFDCTKIIGNIDFCVTFPNSLFAFQSLLWAEAKKGKSDIFKSIVQLILTIGKARTFDQHLPPPFLGAFDAEKIAFIPYNAIQDIFYQNDFNWNVTPSNHETKEFRQVFETVKKTIESDSLQFYFGKDKAEIQEFIEQNFVENKAQLSKIQIDKNNFLTIYTKWVSAVKPTIAIDWKIAQKNGIIDADFYLADLLSKENHTLRDKLYVLLKKESYELDRKIDEMGLFSPKRASFIDKQKAHSTFWNKYERPPKEEYWDYIVERRDLLVPQDVRERKGSFFTPQIWVELSQKYLADVLGEDWQDEYYIWDCAAGTGNLLAGLTNKYNIWASTLDRQDVDVMKDRIQNGANLLESHVFQFDFLNDDFSKLPEGLQKIINDTEKRRKLVIYINPPYAEASSYGKYSVPQVATETKIFNSFKGIVGAEALNELFAQFFTRISKELPQAIIASFTTPKYITSEKFNKFNRFFNGAYKAGFICRSDTFDNVRGKFPIAFMIRDLSENMQLTKVKVDVYDNNKKVNHYWREGTKTFYTIRSKSIANWRTTFYSSDNQLFGYMIIVGPSMQSNNNTFITSNPAKSYKNKGMVANITIQNIMQMSIYLAIRHCIKLTWLNNRDQFLTPNKKWEKDTCFQNDCLALTLFHGQNRISAEDRTNHWIPFTESEVDAKDKFESNFMSKFIAGKLKTNGSLIHKLRTTPLEFSEEAKAVFEAGKILWIYYHQQENINVNASLYDIRAHFQGRNAKGRMNAKSNDKKYTELIGNLRDKLKILAKKIEPKVYEYGFLKS